MLQDRSQLAARVRCEQRERSCCCCWCPGQGVGCRGRCSALLFGSFSSQDQRDITCFERAVTLKTASFEARKGQEPSAMVIAHGREGHVAAPCLSPRSHQLLASNSPPRLQQAAFPPITWILGGLAAAGRVRLPCRPGEKQAAGWPARERAARSWPGLSTLR